MIGSWLKAAGDVTLGESLGGRELVERRRLAGEAVTSTA
jgi:hypothetical protein